MRKCVDVLPEKRKRLFRCHDCGKKGHWRLDVDPYMSEVHGTHIWVRLCADCIKEAILAV